KISEETLCTTLFRETKKDFEYSEHIDTNNLISDDLSLLKENKKCSILDDKLTFSFKNENEIKDEIGDDRNQDAKTHLMTQDDSIGNAKSEIFDSKKVQNLPQEKQIRRIKTNDSNNKSENTVKSKGLLLNKLEESVSFNCSNSEIDKIKAAKHMIEDIDFAIEHKALQELKSIESIEKEINNLKKMISMNKSLNLDSEKELKTNIDRLDNILQSISTLKEDESQDISMIDTKLNDFKKIQSNISITDKKLPSDKGKRNSFINQNQKPQTNTTASNKVGIENKSQIKPLKNVSSIDMKSSFKNIIRSKRKVKPI
ncbi:MAG: hypothetical protein MHPSP_003907, partial [Paramarteilia canceri]